MTTRRTTTTRRAEADTDAEPTGADNAPPPEESGQETGTPVETDNPEFNGGSKGPHLSKPRTGNDVVGDDYPARPYSEAVTDTQRQMLEDAGQWPEEPTTEERVG